MTDRIGAAGDIATPEIRQGCREFPGSSPGLELHRPRLLRHHRPQPHAGGRKLSTSVETKRNILAVLTAMSRTWAWLTCRPSAPEAVTSPNVALCNHRYFCHPASALKRPLARAWPHGVSSGRGQFRLRYDDTREARRAACPST